MSDETAPGRYLAYFTVPCATSPIAAKATLESIGADSRAPAGESVTETVRVR